MKGLFELVGFLATALFSGFLVFTYVGHSKKSASRTSNEALVAEYNTSGQRTAPADLHSISKNRKETARTAAEPSSKQIMPAAPNTAETKALRNLYNDNAFVSTTARKWREAVASAAEENTLHPQLLLAHVIIKTYSGNYSRRDFERDVAEHAGDLRTNAANASKRYEQAWSVNKLTQDHDLAKYFPNSAAPATALVPQKAPRAAAAHFGSANAAPKTSIAQPQKGKPQAGTSAAEAGFREMVAQDEGFSSWAGMQKLADEETKQKAAQRVKRLLLGARVK